jgi:hypothetical protein
MGGMLGINGVWMAYWADEIRAEDLTKFKADYGSPAWQSEWELLAILASLKVFAHMLQGGLVRVVIESDSTSALQASMTLRAHSPQMNRLSGEVALELEANGLDLLWGAHISGADNYLADALSRLSQGASVPECLRDAEWLDAIPRDTNFYRAWR